MTTETKSAFARRLGVSASYVTELAQAGRLVLSGKQVEVEASLARIDATKSAEWEGVRQRHAAERTKKSQNPPAGALSGGGEGGGQSEDKKTRQRPAAPGGAAADLEGVAPEGGEGRKRYKALILQYENQLLKLDMALARGLRYARRGWVASVGAVGGVARAGGERLIDQGAPDLAMLRRDDERLHELGRFVARYRNAIKREFPRALRRQRIAAQGGT